jgi:hypothetical protein
MPYASATEGTSVRSSGDLNAVALRRVWSKVIFDRVAWEGWVVYAELRQTYVPKTCLGLLCTPATCRRPE